MALSEVSIAFVCVYLFCPVRLFRFPLSKCLIKHPWPVIFYHTPVRDGRKFFILLQLSVYCLLSTHSAPTLQINTCNWCFPQTHHTRLFKCPLLTCPDQELDLSFHFICSTLPRMRLEIRIRSFLFVCWVRERKEGITRRWCWAVQRNRA